MALSSCPATFALPVEDVDRAEKFYSETLGLEHTGATSEGAPLFSLGGGASLMLLPRPGGARQESTALTWGVADIAQEVRDLEAAGVRFEDYDSPELTTVDHVADMGGEKAAWFLDPDGNVLCIHQDTR
jgi:catechol 2,3-dioxygenase-like lactoylglutathione lyase family enzyme